MQNPLKILLFDRKGSTVLEFAILAPIYLTIIMAIFEIAVNAYYQGLVDKAVSGAGRLVMTGKIASSNMTQAAFKQAACGQGQTGAQSGLDCSKLTVSIKRVGGSFYSHMVGVLGNGGIWSLTPKLDGVNGNPEVYCPGDPSEIVYIQMTYPALQFTPLPVSTSMFGDWLVGSTAVRNEPFSATMPSSAVC